MGKTKLQVTLPEETILKFTSRAKKQGRSESNLAKKYIIEGLIKDEENERTKK